MALAFAVKGAGWRETDLEVGAGDGCSEADCKIGGRELGQDPFVAGGNGLINQMADWRMGLNGN